MSETGWGIIFVLGLVVAGSTILIVVIWQIFKTAQIKARTEPGAFSDAEYQRIADQVAAARHRNASEGKGTGSDAAPGGRDDAEESR